MSSDFRLPPSAFRLHPLVAEWFARTYRDFTPAQRLCIPAILQGKSVLLSSPTGSGKTLAGFLGIIDWFVREQPPAGRIYALYISPLRSLTYDIQKNLARPLQEMGLDAQIRVGLRTGDTPAKERAAIRRRPPHILLTTPESLAILLCQPAYHDALRPCRFVIVDELHALAENKRGAHLSVSLERLERLQQRPPTVSDPAADIILRNATHPEQVIRIPSAIPHPASRIPHPATTHNPQPTTHNPQPPLCRIGLSATVSPLATMAAFLVGAGRPCVIAEAPMEHRARIEVFSPVRRDPYPPAGQSAGRVLRELAALVRARRSVLIFCNTRAGAETFGLRLREALPELAGQVEIHHSSLDKSVRLEVEDRLKNGELRAVVCSSSLEMGVDIGAVDLVVMISAPKGISRTLQRIGRSGHSVDATSHGILVATSVTDLVECAVTARLARERRLDPVRVPENAADVLVQHLVGLAVEAPGLPVEDAWETVRAAYPFRGLPRADFDRALEYLAGGGRSLAKAYSDTFGKVRVADGGLWIVSPRVARDYLVNIGTIASQGLVDVVLRRRRLGTVEEGFIKGLKPGDVFVLGGRVVRLIEAGWQTVKVEAADGERPNVPTWSAGRMPLTSGLGEEIGQLRAGLDERLRDAEEGKRDAGCGMRDGEPEENTSLPFEEAGSVPPLLPTSPPIPHPASRIPHLSAASRIPHPSAFPLPPSALDWLVEHWELSLANAQAVVKHFETQRRISVVPRAGLHLIELYREPGRHSVSHHFFHSLIGRAANDALSRIVALRVARLAGGNALVTVDDYGFLLTLTRAQELPLARWRKCFARAGAEDDLRLSLKEGELVRWQFRAVAQTGLMVPRQLPGKDRKIRQLRFSAEILFRVLAQHEPDHPLLAEAYRQAVTRFLDLDAACAWLDRLAAPGWDWQLRELPVVSPFAFPLYASQRKESLMFENPEEAVERLYRQFYGSAEGESP